MKKQDKRLPLSVDLMLTFARIGAFTFGGGYAMIPLIQREVVDSKKWISNDDILDIIAIAESTPGPIAINAATFIGKKTDGIRGAMCATLGVALPSFLIISIISLMLQSFKELRVVRYAFWGIRAAVPALILKGLYSLFRQSDKDWFAWLIMAGSFICSGIFGVHVILVIAACAFLGIISLQLRKAGSK